MTADTAIQIYESHDLAISRPPDVVLEEAHKAAKALKKVIDGKNKPVIFNGETYLEAEDWMTVGRFYGITAKITETRLIDIDGVKGYEAVAEAIRNNEVISRAEAMCLRDERNWRDRPMFMLRSMAQTRALSKVHRNVLSWVVVLAGYKPTPAEEMEGVYEPPKTAAVVPPQAPPAAVSGVETPPAPPNTDEDKRRELRDLAELACDLGWYSEPGNAIYNWSKWSKEGKEYGYRDEAKVKFVGKALSTALAEFKAKQTDPKKKDVEIGSADENQEIPF